ncbi:sensor domain-containing diguanylate cyclase [Rhizobium sp. BK529]|uniref:sensor domain-containing diguanylate cyclase n=1 Tax=Rhizobium sp. BK529 TaxID=2586983 RepID=UPI001607AE33|nr:sensor domain-containing diguanylate cyclase [Rhizobium sp. BK529]
MAASRTFGRSSEDMIAREEARLAALQQLEMLDTPRDPGFDRLVRLIKQIFNVDIGIVSFIDAHRQWYKACLGLTPDEMPRQDTFCQQVVAAEDPIVVQDATKDQRFSQNSAVTGEAHVRFYAGVPLRTADGHVVGTVCAIDRRPRSFSSRDLTILEELAGAAMDRVELLRTASSDSLTGAMTRRAFKEEADRLISLAVRHRHDISCLVFDVDHFKQVNDNHGHAAGDEVLRAVASACRTVMRAGDLFSRQGGEEFAILLPHVDLQGALATAERLRDLVQSLSVELPAGALQVSASFGIASLSIVAKDIETLLAQADAAMYQAKQAGRNRCLVWGQAGGADQITQRRRVLKAGSIIFNDRRSTIDCTVRTLGVDGAGLSVSSSTGIPPEFVLAIPSDGFQTRCKIVAQDRQSVEVAFAG